MIWENSIETCILSSVKQTASPGSMHETSAQGWYTRMTQNDGMGKELGGTHLNPWLIHANVWQKPLQYCKVISLQLIKINLKIIFNELYKDTNSFFLLLVSQFSHHHFLTRLSFPHWMLLVSLSNIILPFIFGSNSGFHFHFLICFFFFFFFFFASTIWL